jgi:hypothetical protein
MRYGIVEHREDGDDSPHPYFVVDSTAPSIERGMLGPKYSEAEAKVSAFALTAISEGMTLCAIEPSLVGELFAAGYDTTKGIA